MDSIIVEYNDVKTLTLLEDLEKLSILKLVRKVKKNSQKKNIAELLSSMSKEAGESLEKHIQECRNSWERTL
jgi:hypothetical protein